MQNPIQVRPDNYYEIFRTQNSHPKPLTVVFVPFFGGKKENLKRHIQFVNELGYNAVAFNLSSHHMWNIFRAPPIDRRGRFGIKFKWSDEIERVLNEVAGPKILYCFSSPTACAIDAIARRGATDIRGLVADSGPFVHLWDCFENYIQFEMGIRNKWLRKSMNAAFQPYWTLQHDRTLFEDLRGLPMAFPVLSIRGKKDHLVPEYAIDEVFLAMKHLKLEILRLPNADHVSGLKDEPEKYKGTVAGFLGGLA